MAANPVVDLLAKQSTAKLRTMQHDIEKQINDLVLQAQWIKRAIEEKGGTPATVEPSTSAESNVKRTPPKRRSTGTSAAIRQVLEAEPGRVWFPAEVVREVKTRGVASSAAAIRVALRRMGEDGFLARGPNGEGWKLASANGSYASEPPTGAPSVGLGGMDGATSWPPDDRSGAQAAPNQSGFTD